MLYRQTACFLDKYDRLAKFTAENYSAAQRTAGRSNEPGIGVLWPFLNRANS
jgi:hypothetical protein